MATDEPPEKTAKDVLAGELDPQTRADLERWFGLPSFDQLAEQGIVPDEDPAFIEVRERQRRAIEAVDPEMLAAHQRRTDPPTDLLKFKFVIELRVDPSIAKLDLRMIESAIAEPREREIPEPLRDDLKDCTPQAILRDLHRPETHFDKTFEIVDMAADQRLDIVAEVSQAMATNWKLPPLVGSPWTEAHAALVEFRHNLRTEPWAVWCSAEPLVRRRWKPEEDR